MADRAPGAGPDGGGALARVLRRAGGVPVLDLLAGRLSGADLTTLLLQVMRRRAGRLRPADVLRRYAEDRFTAPATVGFRALRRTEDAVLAALPPEFALVTCSPVAPLGTHSVLATVDQNKVVTTVRGTEVAADPTNALALEAAVRRGRDPRSTDAVRLATVQRVLRGQRFGGPGALPHFTLFGLVSAGRDTGNLGFERRHAVEHLRVLTDAVRSAGRRAQVRLTSLGTDVLVPAVADALPDVDVVADPGRTSGRGYYEQLCFKVYAADAADRADVTDWYEVADGGFVDWTRQLLGSRKERLMISGLGIDRLASG